MVTYAFMMTMTLVLVSFRLPCSSTGGPPTHLLLVDSAIRVLKKTSCTCMPSYQALPPAPQGAPQNKPWAVEQAS